MSREKVEEEFEVPAAAIPIILGKGGQIINQIRFETGAYVHVSENKKGKGLVVVRGTADQVARATAEVKRRVQENEQFMGKKGKKGEEEEKEEEEEEEEEEDKPPVSDVIFPCSVRVLKAASAKSLNADSAEFVQLTVETKVEAGRLCVGTPLATVTKNGPFNIGAVTSIEGGKVTEVESSAATVLVTVKTLASLNVQLAANEELLSALTRESIDALKVHQLEYVKKKENFALLKRIKTAFNIL